MAVQWALMLAAKLVGLKVDRMGGMWVDATVDQMADLMAYTMAE